MSANVLLVEDETAIASVLSRALQARGYAVQQAQSGADCLLAIAESVPDAMLLDINLPDITGWEVLRRLSRTDRERLPVIVFSASPLAPARVQEFRPAGVLIKPFPVDALLRLLGEVIPNSEVTRA